MKASFSKTLVMAGVASALSGVSATSMAAVTGDAGEAFLIPYAVWTDIEGSSLLDTVVSVTIPSTVGGKTIPNIYTANNTTPRGAVVRPPVVSIPANQLPFQVFTQPALIASNWGIHYYFESYTSVDICDGPLPITPEDWNQYRLSDLCPGLPNVNGYLVLTTANGANELDADFAFFADAYLTADNTADPVTLPIPPTQVVSWRIPALPVPDGNDAQGFTQFNEVLESTNPRIDVRPVASGIGTFAAAASVRKVIDLTVADRTQVSNGYDAVSLLVFWNDANLGTAAPVSWNPVTAHLFNDWEWGCSTNIPLPWELNLVWFNDPGEPDPFWIPLDDPTSGGTPAPGRLYEPAYCHPTGNGGVGNDFPGVDAFVRVQLPREGTGATFAERTAMYAFSLQMWYDGAYIYPIAETASIDAHDRGLFASTGSQWVNP